MRWMLRKIIELSLKTKVMLSWLSDHLRKLKKQNLKWLGQYGQQGGYGGYGQQQQQYGGYGQQYGQPQQGYEIN